MLSTRQGTFFNSFRRVGFELTFHFVMSRDFFLHDFDPEKGTFWRNFRVKRASRLAASIERMESGVFG